MSARDGHLHVSRARLWAGLGLALASAGCQGAMDDGPLLSRPEARVFQEGSRFPDTAEVDAVGPLRRRIARHTEAFDGLVQCEAPGIVFKDEERTGADRMMTRGLERRLVRLSKKVSKRWPGVELRVTEAWDENGEHAAQSLHYEGRAADITTSDLDGRKLGELARLAVDAGFGWVLFEDATHVHVSIAP